MFVTGGKGARHFAIVVDPIDAFLLIRALRAVAEAYRRSTSCTQNCNQGRVCTCRAVN